MAICEFCGKRPQMGMDVSHAHNRTKRRLKPNLQKVRAVSGGTPRRVTICTKCLRSGKIVKS